jgi:hypothetical protein
VANPAGGVRSADPFYLPIDSDGYLWPAEVANNHWAVTFDDFRGKTASMGTVDSSCVPRLEMVSPSEFVALTCRGADDRVRMASYGLDGQETWQEDFGDFGPPVFAYAPGAGRFAVSRTVSAVAPSPGMASTIPGSPARQEVRVYQTASGDLLLKVETSPVFKTAENFDLSADGTLAAVVKNGAVEVYKLPALSKRDKEDIAEVAKFAPPPASGPVLLKLLAAPSGSARTAKATENAVPASASSAVPVAADKSAPADSSPGDAAASAPAPRKAPTLLNPGEKPEFGGSAQPN